MATTQSILVIDDDQGMGEIIAATARELGISCTSTSDPETFFSLLSPEITLVLMDLVMPRIDGIQILRQLAARRFQQRIVLMSGLGTPVIETAVKLGRNLGLSIVGHLRKPFHGRELEDILASNNSSWLESSSGRSRPVLIAEEDIGVAIRHKQFVNFYQPQLDVATGSVIGVEALVRWQHPVHGLVLPDSFIAKTERLGLIDQLGWSVARAALPELGVLTAQGMKPMTLSLNVSVGSLQDLAFPDRLSQLAEGFGVHPRQIVLEITESGVVHELSRALDVLARLRLREFGLAIDDFGTGYSMMKQLQNIPATELKIDRTFVMNLHRSKRNRVMVVKTIEIGHELGMHVVAEGVETEEQLDFLRDHACDFAQGYYFSRPQTPRGLIRWLRTRS